MKTITAYFIGGPFDLTKRVMADPGRFYAMAILPPMSVPPFPEYYTPSETIKLEEAKYRRLGSTYYDHDTILFEYMPL